MRNVSKSKSHREASPGLSDFPKRLGTDDQIVLLWLVRRKVVSPSVVVVVVVVVAVVAGAKMGLKNESDGGGSLLVGDRLDLPLVLDDELTTPGPSVLMVTPRGGGWQTLVCSFD